MFFLLKNLNLLKELTLRDILVRYKGTLLGSFWSVLSPLFMLAIYTLVFGSILKARWPNTSDSESEFALILFCGLAVFNLFSEVLIRSPRLILENVNYVKKVIFPLEIMPISIIGSALFNFIVTLLVLLFFYFIFNGFVHWTIILFPFVVLPFIILLLGLSWFLSALGVYARDISNVVTIAVTGLMFLSPLFFPLSSLPATVQQYIYLNPISLIIEELRKVILWGQLPDWYSLAIYLAVALVVAFLGFLFFIKTRKGFADVL